MNDWWKMAIPAVAGAGLLAATGGAAAPGLAGLLGGEGAAGAAGAADAAATSGGMLAANTAAAATPATAFVTPPVVGGASAPMSGLLAGTDMAYGSPAAIAAAGSAAAPQGLLSQAGGYAHNVGKAASTYGMVSNAMGGSQPMQQAPMSRPVYQGDAPSIAQAAGAGSMQPAGNQNLLLAQIARRRQMGI